MAKLSISQLLLLLGLYVTFSNADYQISVLMVEFDSGGKLIDGSDCDGVLDDKCDIFMDICLDPITNSYNDASLSNCSTNYKRTSQFDDVDDVIFSDGQTYLQWNNPQTYTVTGPWEGAYFKFIASDQDQLNPSELIYRFVLNINPTIIVQNMQFNESGLYSNTIFNISISCVYGFGGSTCSESVATTTPSPDRYCNDPHGFINCTCNYGYTGRNCEFEIDWCSSPLVELSRNTTIGKVCSEHGNCTSITMHGATCHCNTGFTGVLCQTAIHGMEIFSQRCAGYETNSTRANNATLGCPVNYRCLLDNLDCAFQKTCENPIGWCTPIGHSTFRKREKRDLLSESFIIASTLIGEICNGRGQPICVCKEGFTGPNCEIKITTTPLPTTTTTGLPTTPAPSPPMSCADLRSRGETITGNYDINIVENGTRIVKNVRCDMTTDGGGWTVVQRRTDGSVDFYRVWDQYEIGFGDSNNFWLGNMHIFYLTNSAEGRQSLRIDLKDCGDVSYFSQYDDFRIANSTFKYAIHVVDFNSTSTAGDSFDYNGGGVFYQNGQMFGTSDEGHDNFGGQCPQYYHGGWWFNRCGVSNLNGRYYPGCYYTALVQDGVYWDSLRNDQYSLKFSEMKIRPAAFLPPP